jgi:hypothetical protein
MVTVARSEGSIKIFPEWNLEWDEHAEVKWTACRNLRYLYSAEVILGMRERCILVWENRKRWQCGRIHRIFLYLDELFIVIIFNHHEFLFAGSRFDVYLT